MQSNSHKSTSRAPYTTQQQFNINTLINKKNNNKSFNNMNNNNFLRVSPTTTPIQNFQIPHSVLPSMPNPVINPNNISNNQQPMITVSLSVLNDLVQKINIYELFITHLFATNRTSNPANNSYNAHASNIYMSSIWKNMPHFKSNNNPKTEPDVMANNNNANNAFYCGADTPVAVQTVPQKQHMLMTPNQNKTTNKIIKLELSTSENQSAGNNKADRQINTRSFNRKIGNHYQNKVENVKYNKEGEYFVCGVCRKRYKYICNLRSHAKVHTDSAYICEFCNKRFGRKSNYMEHKMTHTGELAFKCNVCSKGFRQKHRWKDHCKIHHQNILSNNAKLQVSMSSVIK